LSLGDWWIVAGGVSAGNCKNLQFLLKEAGSLKDEGLPGIGEMSKEFQYLLWWRDQFRIGRSREFGARGHHAEGVKFISRWQRPRSLIKKTTTRPCERRTFNPTLQGDGLHLPSFR
jgi:hypothetical protein